MQIGFQTDVGKVREINEDSIFLEPYSNGLILAIVADGMGGHLAGEIASQKAIEIISEEIKKQLNKMLPINELEILLESAIYQANEKIYKLSKDDIQFRGMGTTIVAALIHEEWIIIGHIGDSRAYLVDSEKMTQITKDHSLVNELLQNGQITEEEAVKHPQKNILTRALGTDETIKIDKSVIHWDEGQSLVLCTDGLTNRVEEKQILQYIQDESISPQNTAEQLVELANQAGGEDNISVIVIRHA